MRKKLPNRFRRRAGQAVKFACAVNDQSLLKAVVRFAVLLGVLAAADAMLRPLLHKTWQLHLLALAWLIVPLVAFVWVIKTLRPRD